MSTIPVSTRIVAFIVGTCMLIGVSALLLQTRANDETLFLWPSIVTFGAALVVSFTWVFSNTFDSVWLMKMTWVGGMTFAAGFMWIFAAGDVVPRLASAAAGCFVFFAVAGLFTPKSWLCYSAND